MKNGVLGIIFNGSPSYVAPMKLRPTNGSFECKEPKIADTWDKDQADKAVHFKELVTTDEAGSQSHRFSY